ncbi:MAG: zinc ribbon domain-containing protein [bacterium]
MDDQKQRHFQSNSQENPPSAIPGTHKVGAPSERCPQCDSEIAVEANFCPNCGIHLTGGGLDRVEIERIMAEERIRQRVRQEMSAGKQLQKSPGLAAFLSLIWIGLGQLYLGRYFKGLTLMILWFTSTVFAVTLEFLAAVGKAEGEMPVFVLSLVALALWVYSPIDAYLTAKRINEGVEFESIDWSTWAIPVIAVEIVFLLLLGLVSKVVFKTL